MDHNSDELSFFAPATEEDLAINLPKLNDRQDLFVKVFDGDLVKAARIAGYVGTPEQLKLVSLRLLKNDNVRTALKNREAYEKRIGKAIMGRDERLLFLSSVARNADPFGKLDEYGKDSSEKEIPMALRLKAVDQLSKASGDYSETLNVNHHLSLDQMVLRSFKDDTPIEVIEAEWHKAKERQQLPPMESELGDLI